MTAPKGAMGSPYCDGSMTDMFNKVASVMAGEGREAPAKAAAQAEAQSIVQAAQAIAKEAVSKVMEMPVSEPTKFSPEAKKDVMELSGIGWELDELTADHAVWVTKHGNRLIVRPC